MGTKRLLTSRVGAGAHGHAPRAPERGACAGAEHLGPACIIEPGRTHAPHQHPPRDTPRTTNGKCARAAGVHAPASPAVGCATQGTDSIAVSTEHLSDLGSLVRPFATPMRVASIRHDAREVLTRIWLAEKRVLGLLCPWVMGASPMKLCRRNGKIVRNPASNMVAKCASLRAITLLEPPAQRGWG